jgi:hypothetical protein
VRIRWIRIGLITLAHLLERRQRFVSPSYQSRSLESFMPLVFLVVLQELFHQRQILLDLWEMLPAACGQTPHV